jgi:hypothetical protein
MPIFFISVDAAQQPRAVDDADRPAIIVDHGQRHLAVGGNVDQLGQRRVVADGQRARGRHVASAGAVRLQRLSTLPSAASARS